MARYPTVSIRMRPVDRDRAESLRREFRDRFGVDLSRAGAIRTALRLALRLRRDLERTDAD